MAIRLFAAIDVGSHETSLRIYEISKKTGIHELEYVHHSAPMGYETYSTGHLSYHSIDKLCTILLGFREKMKEYQITEYMIIATSALREADNNIIVLDQVKQHTGFDIKILSNSEQRYLYYKAIALKENAFHKLIQKGTLLVDVGGGSMQMSLFDNGRTRKLQEAERAVDCIRQKYGVDSIRRASFLCPDTLTDHAAGKQKHLT